jgi:hypothetical protein
VDPGAAASIAREKGQEPVRSTFFFQLLHLSQLSLSQRVLRRFVGSDGGAVPARRRLQRLPLNPLPASRPRQGWSQQPLLTKAVAPLWEPCLDWIGSSSVAWHGVSFGDSSLQKQLQVWQG